MARHRSLKDGNCDEANFLKTSHSFYTAQLNECAADNAASDLIEAHSCNVQSIT